MASPHINRTMTKTGVGTKDWRYCLTIMFVEGIWKIWELWIRNAFKHFSEL